MNPEEILQNRNIKYRYSGADLVVHCLNPEHEDNNPSMRIDKFTGVFNCLSCGYSGTIYKLFDIQKNLIDIRVKTLKDKISKMNKPKVYIPLGAEYVTEDYRDISVTTLQHFEAFTLPGDSVWDGRIIFPIRDINDEIVCLHGRYIYSKITTKKYLTQPVHVNLPLFPASPSIIEGSIILVEGLFDMLNLYDKGLQNTVCVFGANLVSNKDRNNLNVKNKFTKYKLQGINKIYIMFDGDKAGREGAKKLFSALKDSFIVEIIELAEGSDPGSLSADDVSSLKENLYGKTGNNTYGTTNSNN